MTRGNRIATTVITSLVTAIVGFGWTMATWFPFCFEVQRRYPNDIEFIKGEHWIRLVDPTTVPNDEIGVWMNWQIREFRARGIVAIAVWVSVTVALSVWSLRGPKQALESIPGEAPKLGEPPSSADR